MATINLGSLKLNWTGAYNSSTSYAVDDIATANGNSYVCIQAHSTAQAVGNATAYWNIMSSAGTNGTNGTDVGTVITTQGDILYRDGSGLQRLPKGTANQVLKMNSGATAPEYGTLSSDFVRIVTAAGDGTAVLDLDNCFSADYENYRILANIHVSSTTNVNIRLQNSSNSEITTGYYYLGTQNYKSSGSSGTDVKSGWNAGYWQPQESVNAEGDGYLQLIVDVSRPHVSGRTTSMQIRYGCYDGGSFRQVDSYCQERGTDTNKGIRMYVGTGNITSSSSVSVYGIKNS
jgi:hypothetical protein